MYRKIVWYGTILATDIKEISQLVLENENAANRSSGMCTMLYKKVETFDDLNYNF